MKILKPEYIKVTPGDKWGISTPDKRDFEDVKAQIERHVDGLRGVEIVWESYCGFCGYLWDAAPNGYPWCCAEAQVESEANGIFDPDNQLELNKEKQK